MMAYIFSSRTCYVFKYVKISLTKKRITVYVKTRQKAWTAHIACGYRIGRLSEFHPALSAAGFFSKHGKLNAQSHFHHQKNTPDVVVAEFNYQSDFRDRTSNLESLLASVERFPNTRAIVFYEKEVRHQLDKLLQQFSVFKVMAYPIKEVALLAALQSTREEL